MRPYQPPQRFVPSNYGGEEEEGEEKGKTPWQAFIAPLRDIVFGQSARLKAAKIDVQIENMRRKAEGTGPIDWALHNLYIDEIEKLKAQRDELLKMAAEEERATALKLAMYTAGAIGGFVGIIWIGGLAFGAIQKARLTTEKIKTEKSGR